MRDKVAPNAEAPEAKRSRSIGALTLYCTTTIIRPLSPRYTYSASRPIFSRPQYPYVEALLIVTDVSSDILNQTFSEDFGKRSSNPATFGILDKSTSEGRDIDKFSIEEQLDEYYLVRVYVMVRLTASRIGMLLLKGLDCHTMPATYATAACMPVGDRRLSSYRNRQLSRPP